MSLFGYEPLFYWGVGNKVLFRMNIVGTNIIGAILDEELNLVDKFKM